MTALAADPEPTPVQRWTFDQDTLHQPPPGFEFGFTGRGRPGTWVVEDQNGVPSAPNALVQSEGDAGRAMTRFALAGSKKYADVRVRVRCKPLHGGTEKGCGVIVHWQSDSQYVLARASALKHEVVLFVQSGEIRRELGRKKASVAAGRWLTLAVEAKGETLTVRLDGKVVLSVKDGMARGNGRFGVATEADAHSMFDDLEVWDAK
ncbi:MAG: hypothetical protein EXR79_01890 [Myxococcales bacterium]|nr:hypothetical protein [Myxococcales bacterium]